MAEQFEHRGVVVGASGAEAHRLLPAVAWTAALLALVPSIVWQEISGKPSRTLKLAVVVVLATLVGAASRRKGWRPLRDFLAALAALAVGDLVVDMIAGSDAWADWVDDASYPLRQIAEVSLPVIGLALAAATLVGTRMRRKDLYLDVGDTNAPVRERPALPGFSAGEPWRRALLGWRGFLPFFIGIVVLVEIVQVGVDGIDGWRLLRWVPGILVAAAVNAVREELVFRSLLLGRLVPAVGAHQAVWLTAVLFGLGHYFGSPRGLIGVALAGFLGLVFGKCVLETRGLFLVVVTHFVADGILYSFEGASLT